MKQFGWILCLSLLAGCARLDYVKVPTPTQYSNWSDEQQKKADGMHGVRYYLPRPFVHLKQSVPVAQRVAFISFKLESNGNYKVNLPTDAPAWVRRITPEYLSHAQAAAALSASPAGSNHVARQQSGGVGTTNAATTNALSGAVTTETPAQTMTASTGFINETDPITRLGVVMDVVYLPDFEEQFVIQPRVGFGGQADIETRLRNGWAAETFKQKVDTSQLIPYVIRQVEHASDAAAKIATTWAPVAAGLPPGTVPGSLAKSALGIGEQQAGGVEGKTAKDVLGEVLLFKIAEVRVAQPGLYPILKPREIRQWLKQTGIASGIDPEDSFELYLQQANVPWIRPDMAFIPCPPFTMVGFNVTSDIFLAPATDRVNLVPTDREGGGSQPTDSATDQFTSTIQTKIQDAAKTSSLDEIKAMTSVKVEGQGSQTAITLQSASGKPFAKAKIDEYRTWLKNTLKVPNRIDIAAKPPAEDAPQVLVFTIDALPSAVSDFK